MNPDMAHNHVWFRYAPLVEGLGLGPNMVGNVGSGAGEVVGVEKWTRVGNDQRKCYRYKKCSENMPRNISSVATEGSAQGVCW